MKSNAFVWLALNLLSILILAFYSMMEMACVSFNQVRLQYYVTKGQKRAIWLNELLHNPSKLFGTTLIGVNVAMFFGSEFSREFHAAIGLSPDLAPLSQVFLVVIIGELAPMFAARSYPEHVTMLGIPLIYASSKIMTPFLWVLDFVTRMCNWFFKGKESKANIYITQEELQKILEAQQEDQPYASDMEQFNAITTNIFNLRHKEVRQIMTPLKIVSMIPSSATVEDARKIFAEAQVDNLPIYHNEINHIVGILSPRDLIRLPDSKKARDGARVPWFITQTTKLTSLLNQFRQKTQDAAIIVDYQGYAVGIIDLDDAMEEILGKISYIPAPKKISKKLFILERTFPGELKVGDFNSQFDVTLDTDKDMTLGELIEKHLGHHPEKGETVYIDPFTLTVKETSLRGVKSVEITTKIK